MTKPELEAWMTGMALGDTNPPRFCGHCGRKMSHVIYAHGKFDAHTGKRKIYPAIRCPKHIVGSNWLVRHFTLKVNDEHCYYVYHESWQTLKKFKDRMIAW